MNDNVPVTQHISNSRPTRRTLTVKPYLAIYFVALFGIPAAMVVPGFGAGGAPASILGLVAFLWWGAATLIPGQRRHVGFNPIRTALFLYLGVILTTWIHGAMRIETVLEITSSDRALISTFGLLGISLLIMDGIESMKDLEWLVTFMLWCSAFMIFVGMLQFFFNVDISKALSLPGLVANSAVADITIRADFNRPFGTALHPIEYGVVTAALVPYGYWNLRRRGGTTAAVMIALLMLAAMTSLSRSAVLAIGVATLVLLAGSPWRTRFAIVGWGLAVVMISNVLVSGLLDALKSLFTQAENDPSIQARLDRIPKVLHLIYEHPWLGRGFGVYTPEDYFLLDNELQKTAIEMGFIGVGCLLLFIGFVGLIAWRTRVGGEYSRLPGMCLMATIFGLFVSSYTFDAFYYKILSGLLYVSIGYVGALWRLTRDGPVTGPVGLSGGSRSRPIDQSGARAARPLEEDRVWHASVA